MSDLIYDIDTTETPTPALWSLGHCGFAIKYEGIVFYVDPNLSSPGAPLSAVQSYQRGLDPVHSPLLRTWIHKLCSRC